MTFSFLFYFTLKSCAGPQTCIPAREEVRVYIEVCVQATLFSKLDETKVMSSWPTSSISQTTKKLRCHFAVVFKPQLLALLVLIFKKEAVTCNDALECNNQWRLPHLLSLSRRDRINFKWGALGVKVKSKQDDHDARSKNIVYQVSFKLSFSLKFKSFSMLSNESISNVNELKSKKLHSRVRSCTHCETESPAWMRCLFTLAKLLYLKISYFNQQSLSGSNGSAWNETKVRSSSLFLWKNHNCFKFISLPYKNHMSK